MPPPKHVSRVVICPTCQTERVTRAHPNVLLKCVGCGEKFRVYTDQPNPDHGAGPPASEAETEPARQDADTGQQKPSPAPPAPAQQGEPSPDFVDVVDGVTFPPAEPPPVGERPSPEPGAEEQPAEPPTVEDDPGAEPPTVVGNPAAEPPTVVTARRKGGRRWRS